MLLILERIEFYREREREEEDKKNAIYSWHLLGTRK